MSGKGKKPKRKKEIGTDEKAAQTLNHVAFRDYIFPEQRNNCFVGDPVYIRHGLKKRENASSSKYIYMACKNSLCVALIVTFLSLALALKTNAQVIQSNAGLGHKYFFGSTNNGGRALLQDVE